MPLIRGRYYANPSYGDAMERGREEDGDGEGPVHHIQIRREPNGMIVHVHRHGPGSGVGDPEPSGAWSTHMFEDGDHEGVGHFVTSVLGKGKGKPTGARPFRQERV